MKNTQFRSIHVNSTNDSKMTEVFRITHAMFGTAFTPDYSELIRNDAMRMKEELFYMGPESLAKKALCFVIISDDPLINKTSYYYSVGDLFVSIL